MSEICPARNVTAESAFSGSSIREPYIPDACMSCINRAEFGTHISIKVSDTFDENFAHVREQSGRNDVPANDWDRWRAVFLQKPQEGLARAALIETGFDTLPRYGQSYEEGTEITSIDLKFDCSQEASEIN